MTARLGMVVVVPFLNEAEHLPTLLGSVERQRRPPDQLLLVDDGSTDASAGVAARFAAEHSYARMLRRPPRRPERDRMARAHVWRAFTWGLAQANCSWDVAAKLDADLRLTPDLFAEMERHFLADPGLGMAGSHLAEVDAGGRLVRLRCPDGHVEGPNRFYRRACLESISPVPPIVGWDTIDETRAQMRGWRTQTIETPAGDQVHLRRMGSYDGVLRGYRRAGHAAYSFGSHPLHAVAAATVRLRDRPLGLCGASYLAGYALAAGRRAPRAEAQLRAYVRRAQLRRLRQVLDEGPRR